LFKAAFEAPAEAAGLLRGLLPPAVSAMVAWETLEHGRGSFVDLELADRHNDLLFSARLRNGEPGVIFLVLEHQSTGDPAMPQRMLAYQSRIWDRCRKERRRAPLPPVIAVLVSHVPGGWTAPRAFEQLFDPVVRAVPELDALMPRFAMVIDDLADLSDADLKARPLAPFQQLALWLLRDARDATRLLESFDVWIPELARTGPDHFRVLIEYMFRVVDPVTREALRAKIRTLGPSAEETAMTIADQIHEEGRQRGRVEGRIQGEVEGRIRGRAEGRFEGRIEGCVETLRRLLVLKFGDLDAVSEARLRTASLDAVDRYLERVLTADCLAAVFED
jgi:predicted transposase YdaD